VTALEARVVARRGSFVLDVALDARAGDVLAVVGPNGAGKSTLLRALAGLVPLVDGRVTCGDVVWDDVATGAHVRVEGRGAGLVLQRPVLFPALTVEENVGFGLRARGVVSRVDEARAALDRMGLGALAARRVDGLSGGEAQAVCLARALVMKPRVLLLDEPLASLDVESRGRLRALLREVVSSSSAVTLLVTHDPVDAFTLATHVLCLEGGRVVERGSRDDVLARPTSAFLAALAGQNALAGEIVDGRFVVGRLSLAVDGGAPLAPGPARAALPMEAVRLVASVAPRAVAARVTRVEASGSRVRALVDVGAPLWLEVSPRDAATLAALREGAEVHVEVTAGVTAWR
jgi:molybdate transport system ATP-binding protein